MCLPGWVGNVELLRGAGDLLVSRRQRQAGGSTDIRPALFQCRVHAQGGARSPFERRPMTAAMRCLRRTAKPSGLCARFVEAGKNAV